MTDTTKLDNSGRAEEFAVSPAVETRSAGIQVDSVDFGQRIITVLAVPYEQPTKVWFQNDTWNEVFSRTAFNGIENLTRKIPATAALEIPAPEHRGGRLVGKIISSDPYGEAGLVSEVKISRTEQGDELLELSRDEAVQVSVGFMVKNPRMDQELDRYNKTRRVGRAFLDHLAFVAQPAYEGTKILSMRSEDLGTEQVQSTSRTPLMDQWLSDPILRWASEHVNKP